ncbi:hypothetical protein DL95DRAFT_438073 [Leptodontidium sp. 2 PMI_412]|nr:hypothetical protein DL95DRAFT_438073 [Leptodontidium sp. 2 PMI_412]
MWGPVVIRHNPNSAVYNGAYINERVPFDVLSAILERPSADSILRMLTYMSLMRDPRALVHVPDVLAALPPDPRDRIQGTEVEAEVRRLTAEIGTARTRWRNIISEEYRADYFRRRPLKDIERQNRGQQEDEYIEPLHSCRDITSQNIVARRIHSAGLIVALCRRRDVPRRYRLRVAFLQPVMITSTLR